MKKETYNKLVRDRIPDIIMSKGAKPVTRTADDEEYYLYLKQKLIEEVREFDVSNNMEEIADILEVMHAIIEHRRVSFEDIERFRKEKAEKRGSFKDKIILEEVHEG